MSDVSPVGRRLNKAEINLSSKRGYRCYRMKSPVVEIGSWSSHRVKGLARDTGGRSSLHVPECLGGTCCVPACGYRTILIHFIAGVRLGKASEMLLGDQFRVRTSFPWTCQQLSESTGGFSNLPPLPLLSPSNPLRLRGVANLSLHCLGHLRFIFVVEHS